MHMILFFILFFVWKEMYDYDFYCFWIVLIPYLLIMAVGLIWELKGLVFRFEW